MQKRFKRLTYKTTPNKKFALSLHYNGDNFYFFVNGVQEIKFKTKNSEIK